MCSNHHDKVSQLSNMDSKQFMVSQKDTFWFGKVNILKIMCSFQHSTGKRFSMDLRISEKRDAVYMVPSRSDYR